MTPKVWVFFYGSYMNRGVLAEVGIQLEEVEVAAVAGWDIVIRPRANLVRTEGLHVHGILTRATHDELSKLYAHARDVLGEVYLPEAVLAETRSGAWRPALCYVATAMEPRAPEVAYVDRIIDAACEHGLPADYVARLEAFRPVPRGG